MHPRDQPLADVDTLTAQLEIQPAFLPANAALPAGAPSSFAILDSGLSVAGDQGSSSTIPSSAASASSNRGSLAQRMSGGVAAWPQVVARGWPGEYRLVVSVGSATGVYKVGTRAQ